jgi:hypothetical protein
VVILREVSEMGKRRAKVKGKRVPTSVPENYVERGGASGRALDYWLQAVVELKRFLPQHLTELWSCKGSELGRMRTR